MSTKPAIMKFDSSRSDFMPYGFTCVLWSPTAMPRPDRHNEIEINYLPSGTLTYLLGGRLITIEARRLALFWAAMPHQILRWETTKPYYVATLPLAWFLGYGLPEHFAHPILAGEVVADPVSTSRDEAFFRRWEDDLRSKQPLRERAAQIEIQARLLRLAQATRERSEVSSIALLGSGPDPLLSRADQIACYIAQNYAEPLRAEGIAKAVGLHPNYAMGVFRKAFGMTMVEFLIHQRLAHAQRLLLTTDDPVVEIAASAGFTSLSRFNEAFKRACGCSPRSYRGAHRISKES